MSAKWSVQPVKGTVADADVLLIIDSEAGPVDNKQVLFSTLALAAQTPWRGDIDAATFNLDNLTSVDLNNALGTNPIIFALQSASESTVVFGSNFQLSSGFIDISEIATPTNPATDVGRLYVQDDGGITTLFFRDSTGTITDLVSGGGGGHVIEDEGTPLTQRANLNFVGNGVNVTDNDPDTLVTINAYSAIFDDGTGPLAQRSEINFAGAGVTVTDDIGNQQTLVTIPGAGSSLATLTDVDLTGQAIGGLLVNVDGVNWNDLPVGSETEVLTIVGGIPAWAAAGEVNLGANVGAGTGLVFRDKTGVTLNFKSLIAGSNITLNNNADDIEIIATGSSPTTTQGDIIARNLTQDVRFPVGVVGQYLGVSTATPTLLLWRTLFYQTILDEATPVTQRDRVAFVGSGVTVTDSGSLTTVTIPETQAYQTVEDEGIAVAQETIINFVGAGVTATPGTGKTTVTISGSASPLTTKGDVFGFDTGDARVPIGTDGQVLTANSAVGLGLEWATPAAVTSPLTTLGDLYGFSTVDARIPVGSPGQHLTVLTAQPTSVGWSTPSGSGYDLIQDEGTPVTVQKTIDFVGAGVTAANGTGVTTVTIPGFTSPVTTQGDIFGRDATGDQRFPIGSPGQQLTVNTGQPTNLQWVTPASRYTTIEDAGTPIAQENTLNFTGAGVTASAGTGKTTVDIPGGASVLTTQGDILGRNLTTDARFPIGTPGQVLRVTTASPTLLQWFTLPTNGYITVRDEGTPLTQGNTIDFVGAGVIASDGAPGITTVTISGSASPLTTKGDVFGFDTGDARLPVGTNTQVLTANSAVGLGIEWADAFATPLTTQGDLFGRDGSGDQRIPIGSPGQVLTVQTAQPTQVNWVTPASTVSVIGHVDVVTPTNSISVVLSETINFDDTVTDIELVGSFSLAVADTVGYFINSLSQTAYSSTFVFVSNTGTVTGQNTANASVGWTTGKSFAAGLSAAVKLRLNIGDSISLNSRPTGEIWETPGDTTGDLYRAGRVNYVATPAPTSITSIQITTAGTQNFEAGSSFTVIKRTTS